MKLDLVLLLTGVLSYLFSASLISATSPPSHSQTKSPALDKSKSTALGPIPAQPFSSLPSMCMGCHKHLSGQGSRDGTHHWAASTADLKPLSGSSV